MIIIRKCIKRAICSAFSVAIILVGVESVQAASDSSSGQKAPPLTITFETVHNPPRVNGRGTTINWNKPGLTLELLRLIGKHLDLEIQYKRMPWKRGLYFLEKNEVDGIFHASFKPEREALGVYPKKNGKPDTARAIFNQSYVLYTLKSSSVGVDDGKVVNLDGTVGAITGYSVVDALQKMGLDVEEKPTLTSNFDRLLKGEIAAFSTLENMADDFLARNSDRYTNIVKVQPALKFKPYYLLFSHQFVENNGALAEKIWNSISEIQNSEEFRAIESRY